MHYKILDWDSSFFGFPVAKITYPFLPITQLHECLSILTEEHKIRLVYWPSDRLLCPSIFRGINGKLVDIKETYIIDLQLERQSIFSTTHPVETFSKSMSIADMETLAVQSGFFSRFSVDDMIPKERFESLYKIWINRSISKYIAKEVLVVNVDHKIVGMITLGEIDKKGNIGLLAVNQENRGQGLGKQLVQSAHEWFFREGYLHAQVVTQRSNTAARMLYRKCGYTLDKVEYFYHFWL